MMPWKIGALSSGSLLWIYLKPAKQCYLHGADDSSRTTSKVLIYTLGLRPLAGLLRYCNPHDNLCWNLTADDLAAYQYLNEVFVVLTWILTSAVFDKNWSVNNCESYVWNSGASKPVGEFVFIRFGFCSIFVNFLPLAMVMSFLNGAAEALVPKECLTCLGHGPGDATSQKLGD